MGGWAKLKNYSQLKTEDLKEISSDYRNSRKATSIFCGIGLAWSAAQFEIKNLSLGSLGNVDIENASIPILIGILCLYTMFRTSLEYMMQPKTVRRWSLAKLDYRVTWYLVRFTLVVLTVSAIARSWKMVFYIGGAFILGVIIFFLLTIAFMFIIVPPRLFIGRLSGRRSLASLVFESMAYSFALSGIVYIASICLIAYNGFNPFLYLGGKYQEISNTQILIFSGVCLSVIFSFFLDGKFLAIVFAFEPITIERKYMENGKEIISVEPNPNHPEYEKNKNDIPVIKYVKVRVQQK